MEELKTYTLHECEEILTVTQRTLYNYIKKKQLRAVKMGRYWRVPHEELARFIREGTTLYK